MRVLGISDTHGHHERIWNRLKDEVDLEQVDTIIHSGDISSRGTPEELKVFLKWFNSLPFKNKVFILGNHELGLESEEDYVRKMTLEYENIHYLHHESIILDGVHIFGSPYTPYFHGWAYNVARPDLHKLWGDIPNDIDILVTHGPPFGLGDSVGDLLKLNTGDKALLDRVMEIVESRGRNGKSLMHQFGHIHEGFGTYMAQDVENLLFKNVACLTRNYELQNSYVHTTYSV